MLDTVGTHPGVRDARLSGDSGHHRLRFQAGNVVIPRGGQRPRLAQAGADLIVARMPVVGPVGHIPRRCPRTAALGRLTARLYVGGVVVAEVFKDKFIGATPDHVDVLHGTVDRPAGRVAALGHPAAFIDEFEHRFAAAHVGDDAMGVPFSGLPHATTVGCLDPSAVVALGDQLRQVAREASFHECGCHHVLTVPGLGIARISLFVGLRKDQVISIVFEPRLAVLRRVLPHPSDEVLRCAIADR